MLDPLIIRILIIIGFFFFGYNITYIILLKKRNKTDQKDNEINEILKKTRFFVRIGINVLNIFIFLCCLNIFIYDYWLVLSPRINLFFLSDTFQVIGFTLVIGGNITLMLAYRKLGIYWSYPRDGITKKKKLIKTGIYGKIRHPVYLSFNIFCIGFIMILLDWILLILYIIGAIGLYFQAIDEERILIKYFGQEYETYMNKTGRFFVKIRKG
ncbi:MAG: methyltransferase family protein [Candidatus Heimdallarchaeota archaeon]